jgi:hypothetical protein
MTSDFKLGTLVHHEVFGYGKVVGRDADHIEVDFGAKGSKRLVAAIAARVMKITGFRDPSPSSLPLVKPQKAEKTSYSGIRDPYVVRGRDEWDRENTTPNTPLYRTGRR